MSGINYDLKKIRGFAFDIDGVLSPTVIPMSEDGQPMRMANVKDGYALQLAVKLGYKIAIISGGFSESSRLRFKSLGIGYIVMGASHKLEYFEKWASAERLEMDEIIYMGDDIPDLRCMRKAGLPCAPRDAAREACDTALYVSRFDGGYGCARDVLEQVMKAQGKWLDDDSAFTW